jgi:hypothetical protein
MYVVMSGARRCVVVQELEREPAKKVALLGQVPTYGTSLVITKCIDGLNLQDLQTMRQGNLVFTVYCKLFDSRI